MKKFVCIFLLSIVLSACAAQPTVVKVEKEGDRELSCNKLYDSVQEAAYYKDQAIQQDKFKIQYLMPMNAMISTFNIYRAKSNAGNRIDNLTNIAEQKGCMNKSQPKVVMHETEAYYDEFPLD